MIAETGIKIKSQAEQRITDMKIGIFGGAFNPVHNGHIHLMNCYLNQLELDKIILIPTAVPPHKNSQELISGLHRINMLKIAVGNNPKFEISDIEFKRNGKSYTYDTLCQLKKIYPNDEFYLIVGSDQYLNFKSWYNFESILDLATLVTAAREENEYNALLCFKKENPAFDNSVISSFNVVKVSSSQIRQLICEKSDVSSFLPDGVYSYIKEKELYV